MEKEFDAFVSRYDLTSRGIKLKKEHSKRVRDISIKIAKNLKWNDADVLLASQIGLLHDIGRFPEWKEFHSYGGNLYDHGNVGVEALKKYNLIEKCGVLDSNKEILYNAVYYHNKKHVPQQVNNKYIKLIRDADKLDILYLLSVRGINCGVGFDLNHEISPEVYKDFMAKKTVTNEDVKTNGDCILQKLALVFDINYDYSLSYIKENKFIDTIIDTINNKEVYSEYFDMIYDFIEKRI